MRLSEILRPAHFQVAAGLSPAAWELESATNTTTKVQEAQSQPLAASLGQEEALLQTCIVRIWDCFKHNADNTINREEYECFQKRLLRVLLPSLGPTHEQMLATNAWEHDSCGLDKMPFGFFQTATTRLARMWTNSSSAAAGVKFLQTMIDRITCMKVVKPDGQAIEASGSEFDVQLSIPSPDDVEASNNSPLDAEISAALTVKTDGYYPTFSYQSSMRIGAMKSLGVETIIFVDEVLKKPDLTEGIANASVAVTFKPFDEIVPIGYATLAVLMQATQDCSKKGVVDVECEENPNVASNTQAIKVFLEKKGYNAVGAISCKLSVGRTLGKELPEVSVDGKTPLGSDHILGMALIQNK
jgi:hypothetical protein